MDYRKFDDPTLLKLIAKADQNALGELYERLSRLVYSIALNALNDPSLAEEVTQDVFLRVWQRADTYRAESGKVVTWIAGITRNRAVDQIRYRNIRPQSNQVPWDTEVFELQDESQDVEVSAAQNEQRKRVRRAVSQLPPEQQQVLALAYFQGYSHSEIADYLDEPLGTVKTRIRLAMKKLKQALEENELAEEKSIRA